MSTAATSTRSTKERSTKGWLQPFFLAVPFTAIVTGLFNLSDMFSVPGGLLVGAAWGVVLGLIVGLIRKNDVVAAWFEDVLVVLGGDRGRVRRGRWGDGTPRAGGRPGEFHTDR
jgi:hypothetical protein